MMRRINNLTRLLILLQLILLWPLKTGAFSVIQLLHSSRLVETVSAFALYASQDKDINSDNDDDGPLFSSSSSQSSLQNFNPFQPVSSNRNQNQYNPIKSNNSINTININNNNVLSLRKLQMQSILQDLLAVTNDEMMTISTKQEQHKTILHAHRDFLLAPFTDNDFVDDNPDSIYQSSHPSPSARWETFHTTMTSRIQAARNPSVQIVLEALLEYVQQELEVEQEQQS